MNEFAKDQSLDDRQNSIYDPLSTMGGSERGTITAMQDDDLNAPGYNGPARGFAYSTDGGHAPLLVRKTTMTFKKELAKAQKSSDHLLNSE